MIDSRISLFPQGHYKCVEMYCKANSILSQKCYMVQLVHHRSVTKYKLWMTLWELCNFQSVQNMIQKAEDNWTLLCIPCFPEIIAFKGLPQFCKLLRYMYLTYMALLPTFSIFILLLLMHCIKSQLFNENIIRWIKRVGCIRYSLTNNSTKRLLIELELPSMSHKDKTMTNRFH